MNSKLAFLLSVNLLGVLLLGTVTLLSLDAFGVEEDFNIIIKTPATSAASTNSSDRGLAGSPSLELETVIAPEGGTSSNSGNDAAAVKPTVAITLSDIPTVPDLPTGGLGEPSVISAPLNAVASSKASVLVADPISGITLTDDFHPQAYNLSFHDEFNDKNLKSLWMQTLPLGDRTVAAQDQLQCFLDKNLTLSAGHLNITAKKEKTLCPPTESTLPYSSGILNSLNAVSQAYGYFAIRAKLPAVTGVSAQFILMPKSGAWIPEIDVFRTQGSLPTEDSMAFRWQEPNASAQLDQMDQSQISIQDFSADYHVYAIDWQPGLIRWLVDGVEVKKTISSSVPSGPFFFMIDLVVGGFNSEEPDSNSVFPATMFVDWVRVYSMP